MIVVKRRILTLFMQRKFAKFQQYKYIIQHQRFLTLSKKKKQVLKSISNNKPKLSNEYNQWQHIYLNTTNNITTSTHSIIPIPLYKISDDFDFVVSSPLPHVHLVLQLSLLLLLSGETIIDPTLSLNYVM